MWDNGLPKWEVPSEVPNINFRSCAFTSLAVLFALFYSGIKIEHRWESLFICSARCISSRHYYDIWHPTHLDMKIYSKRSSSQMFSFRSKCRCCREAKKSTGRVLDQEQTKYFIFHIAPAKYLHLPEYIHLFISRLLGHCVLWRIAGSFTWSAVVGL
jgi:hypothetical protein